MADVFEVKAIARHIPMGTQKVRLVVNAVREKEKTNMRTHTHDDAVKLSAPVLHTLETAVEFIAEDEFVEVTPTAVRIRKRVLVEGERRRANKKA